MQQKKWIFKPAPNPEDVQSLSGVLNINPWLASLLMQRGISTYEAAKSFFRPQLSMLHDPFLMKNMQKAAERLSQARKNRENIMIYGDYDVDGTTSVAMVYGFLANYYPSAKLFTYIPDRYSEGYGISFKGIDYAAEKGISLIIALDCGIRAVDKVAYAAEKKIELIICDHHEPGQTIPQATAVLDPKQKDCAYPYKALSGCGTGFKLMQAFCVHNNIEQENLYPFLDLLAVSIASDIVPITGENRVLCYFGLKQLNHDPRPGLKALIKIAGFQQALDVNNIVFGIGPRINAAGRIEHGKGAVELLLASDETEALDYARNIDVHNQTRKNYDSTITQEALKLIEENHTLLQANSTVLYKEDWHKGVIGIVASRCIETYYRPTVILTRSNGMATGSARSVEGFNLYEAICECSEFLEQYGGHTHAAGLTLPVENIEAFRNKFESVVSSKITPELLTPRLEIDAEIPLNIINSKFLNIIKQMGPFGPYNMQPVFASRKVSLAGKPRIINESHIKFSIRQAHSSPIEVIGFGFAAWYEELNRAKYFDIVYTIGENTYKGITTTQLFLKDIRV